MGRRSAADSDILLLLREIARHSREADLQPCRLPKGLHLRRVRATCNAILEDDRGEAETSAANIEPGETSHPWATHPLLSRLLIAVESWMQQESVGGDAAAEIGEMREIADRMMRG